MNTTANSSAKRRGGEGRGGEGKGRKLIEAQIKINKTKGLKQRVINTSKSMFTKQ